MPRLPFVLKNHPEFPEGIYGWGGAYGANWMVDFQNGITAVYMKNSNIYEGAEFETIIPNTKNEILKESSVRRMILAGIN